MRVIRANDREYIPASHEDPTKPGVMKKVLATKAEIIDGKVQMINWAKLPVGTSFRLHYHEDMEETFIMVCGTAQMRIADQGHTHGGHTWTRPIHGPKASAQASSQGGSSTSSSEGDGSGS